MTKRQRLKMSELTLSEHVLYVRGEVSFKTVTHLRAQLQRIIQTELQANRQSDKQSDKQSSVHTLDCSGVTKVDSSIASLLLAALALTNTSAAALSIIRLPPAAIKLLKLYDLDGIIQHH